MPFFVDLARPHRAADRRRHGTVEQDRIDPPHLQIRCQRAERSHSSDERSCRKHRSAAGDAEAEAGSGHQQERQRIHVCLDAEPEGRAEAEGDRQPEQPMAVGALLLHRFEQGRFPGPGAGSRAPRPRQTHARPAGERRMHPARSHRFPRFETPRRMAEAKARLKRQFHPARDRSACGVVPVDRTSPATPDGA
jgi:hypothetical protein